MVTSQVTAESASSNNGGHNQLQTGCSTASTSEDNLYCCCRGPEEGSMIACDNKECKIDRMVSHDLSTAKINSKKANGTAWIVIYYHNFKKKTM